MSVSSIQKSSSEQVPSTARLLSEQFLDAVRGESSTADRAGVQAQSVKDCLAALEALDPSDLRNELNTDAKKKAFWINLYNAFFQYYAARNPIPTSGMLDSLRVYSRRFIKVAGQSLSLNDLEHGILRRSRVWWSLGYLKKIRASDFERVTRVDKLDPRIHFALNCGAVSCPPIRHYKPEQIEEQLDTASIAYLDSVVRWDEAEKTLYLPQLLQMFRGDFDGRKGEIQFLNQYADQLPAGRGKFIDPNNRPKVRYVPFDRTLKPEFYAD